MSTDPTANPIVDPVLPAAVYLTGVDAADVLAPVLEAAGERLVEWSIVNVHYRPHRELVVRFSTQVDRAGRTGSRTVLAGTTSEGIPPGTVGVEATLDDGTPVAVGVWTWPFDPVLPALTAIVTPGLVEPELAALELGARAGLDVVAYRPTERAVVRVTAADDAAYYVKVVRPADTARIVATSTAFAAAGVPTAPVLAHDAERGWVAFGELAGPTLRDLLVGPGPLPAPHLLVDLIERFASVDPTGLTPKPSRRRDAAAHAAMLRAVLPSLGPRLDGLVAAVRPDEPGERRVPLHGDLHEAQLVMTDEGALRGVLDLDDAGLGDPVEDAATLVGHLRYRAVATTDPIVATRLGEYAALLREALVSVVGEHLDRGVAGVMVGLATGPFRIQADGWPALVEAVVADAERALIGQPVDTPDRHH